MRSGNLQQATSNFINVNQVKNNKEIILREIVAALSEGHGNWASSTHSLNKQILNKFTMYSKSYKMYIIYLSL